MAIIDSFELVTDQSEKPFITLRDRSITFSKTAIESLGYAEFVHMYIDKKGRKAAFLPCGNDSSAIPFYREPKEGRPVLVRISDKKKALLLMNLAQVNDCGKGLRFYGTFVEDEKTLLIDMTMPDEG